MSEYRSESPPVEARHDLEARCARLEDELHACETELLRARRMIRKRKTFGAFAHAGFGSLAGSFVGFVAFGASDDGDASRFLLYCVVLGLAFGLLASWRANPPNDGFPPAPRNRYLPY
jgi:uncharacterized membrane protein YfcA